MCLMEQKVKILWHKKSNNIYYVKICNYNQLLTTLILSLASFVSQSDTACHFFVFFKKMIAFPGP